jgi:hypothetical protein
MDGVARVFLTQKEKSRLSAGPSCSRLSLVRLAAALTLLVGFLALTIRILLLLSGLLATALLLARLLTRVLILLTRVLVLLTRVLILAGHRDLPV